MNDLVVLNKSVMEIAQLLAQDKTLCKLLLIDEPNALTASDIDINFNDLIKDDYICIFPPIDSAIQDYTRNTFITIMLDSFDFGSDNEVSAQLYIHVTTNKDHLLLDNNKIRLLEMCNLIVNDLNNKKLSASNNIEITHITQNMLSNFRQSYVIRISLVNQNHQKAEI